MKENKYLPIGSVCTLKGKNKKVMITGYYSVEFVGNFKIKDYSGCAYPEGLLLPDQVITFNHSDIENIDFIGYKNDEEITFQNLLNRLTGNLTEEEQAAEMHKNNDMFLASSTDYSKLLFDENGVVMIAEPAEQPKQESESTNIEFDANGTVISDGTKVNNPFHKDYSSKNVESKDLDVPSSIFTNIEFDENGVVTKVDSNDTKSELKNIEFDENGIVISVGKEQLELEEKQTNYKFDENGILISDGTSNFEAEAPSMELQNSVSMESAPIEYKFDANGTVVAEPTQSTHEEIKNGMPTFTNIQFDENGVVTSVQ